MINTPRLSIEQKAARCAKLVVDYSKKLTIDIRGDAELTNPQIITLFTYSAALNYIVIDRQAFLQMTKDEREKFGDYLLFGLQKDIARGTGIEENTVMELLNASISDLSPFSQKLMAAEGESDAGTLYWSSQSL